MSSAQYRIFTSAGAELESGSADASVSDGTLVVSVPGRASLRVPFGQITSIVEPQQFSIGVTLADGTAIELSRLGPMRTQLLAELREGRAGAAAQASGAVGDGDTFRGTVRGVSVELSVFEDALLVLGDGAAERIGFSFVTAVATQDYAVTVTLSGGSQLVVSRLGRRTEELAALLNERLSQASGRTAAFLGSLLPGLDPMAQRATAGLLRDGVAVPARALDAIHPEISGTLLHLATLPDRLPAVSALSRQAELAIGFKQRTSVTRPAVGGTPWYDHAATPHIGQHDSPGGLFQPGLGGAMAAGVMGGMGPGGHGPGGGYGGFGGYGGYGRFGGGYGGPFGGGYGAYGGGFGDYWAYRAIGCGMNANRADIAHQMTPRADVRRGRLTPATEDLAALTTSGADPTVLAFALLSSAHGRVALEVLNVPEPATFVYESDGDARGVINRWLDDTGFQAAAVHATGLTAAARTDPSAALLARSLVAQVPHDENWQRQIADFLTR
jgi:hypothetical protein